MTERYTPSLADGQSYYVAGRADARKRATGEQALDITPYSAEFDRMIEAVRAEAWDKGYGAGRGDGARRYWDGSNPVPNPHRKGQNNG